MSNMRIFAAAMLLAGAAGLAAQPVPNPAAPQAPADVAVTPDDARRTAAELAERLAESYVFPEVGERYAAMLRANAGSGAYDGFTSGRALAERLGYPAGDLDRVPVPFNNICGNIGSFHLWCDMHLNIPSIVALHHARGKDWREAVPVLERIVAEQPERRRLLRHCPGDYDLECRTGKWRLAAQHLVEHGPQRVDVGAR